MHSVPGLPHSNLSTDEACELHVIDERGSHLVFATAGETLLATLHNHGIAIGAVCGGNMICGTCHVWLYLETASDYPPRGPEETELLKLSSFYRPNQSRLACQMKVHRGIQGLRVEVAPDE